jgi:hypothetical protein
VIGYHASDNFLITSFLAKTREHTSFAATAEASASAAALSAGVNSLRCARARAALFSKSKSASELTGRRIPLHSSQESAMVFAAVTSPEERRLVAECHFKIQRTRAISRPLGNNKRSDN